MRLFVAIAAVLAVAEAGRRAAGGSLNGVGSANNKPSKKVRRGGLGYISVGPAHHHEQQSLQGIINGLTASAGGLNHGHGATSYAYVSGVGNHVGSAAQQVAYGAPQVAYAAPQVAYGAPQVAYAAPQVAYGAPQVAYGAPQVAYGAPEQQVAYAPQVVAGASPEYGVPAGGPVSGGDLASQISKSVYVFSAPHDPSDNIRPQVYKSFPHKKQKHFQVVFINAPNPPLPPQHTVELPSPPELKTQIYVLVKKPQKAPPIKVIPAKVPVNKPEVFFIRYKNGQGQDSAGNLVEGPEGPLLDGPGAYGPPSEGPGAYGPPPGDEGGYPEEPSVAVQEEYGAPPHEVSEYSGGNNHQHHHQYAQEVPDLGEGQYGGPPPSHSGGHEEYVVSSEGGGGGEYGAGPPYESSGDTYGEYSKHISKVSPRFTSFLRRRKPSSMFRMSSRSDDGGKWKPMIPSRKRSSEPDAGMSGI